MSVVKCVQGYLLHIQYILLHHELLVLVVARPENYARMDHKPGNLIGYLLLDILEKRIIGGIESTCKPRHSDAP